MDPKGRTAWVTGASSGIGAALAVELAGAGAKVIASARRRDRLERTAGECRSLGAEAAALELDVSDPGSIPGKAREAGEIFGGVDMLLHAAGVGQRGEALETAPDVARRIFETDFWGAVELTRAVLPSMLAGKGGQIVVCTSLLGKFGAPRRSFYSAAKHALHGWFDSLREETAGKGIEVTLLVPGWVRTEISEQAMEPDGQRHGAMDAGQEWGLSAGECARRAMPAIVSGRPEQLLGGIECAAAYLNRVSPGLLRRVIRRRGIG